MIEAEQPVARKSWPDYRAVWRWHFYAGIFCIPFIIVMASSGSIYLFKPQIESWIDRNCDNLAIKDHPASAADQIRAALAAVPGSSLNGYEMPEAVASAARVIVSKDGTATRVYVHPETLQILKTVDENARFMKVLFRLHGELLMGNRGSAVVELAASWAIIMIVTGLYLWLPRRPKTLGGILYPRFGGGSRIFWRDIHGVTGFWISGLALFLLFTGLPWAKFWGDYFKNVRRITGAAVARQDWANGQASTADRKSAGSTGEPGEHHASSGSGGARRRRLAAPVDLTAVDRIVATLHPLDLDAPVVIAPPDSDSGDWTAKSMTANRPRRVDLVMDGKTGAIKDRKDFHDRHLIDRIVGTGIAAHEGQLFGWPNQLLGLVTAAGLVLLAVSSVCMWWRRRHSGGFGAPGPAASPRFSLGLCVIVVLFGIYLPCFGASLIAVLLVEWALLRRIPAIRDWLGLQIPLAKTVKTASTGTWFLF